MSLSLFFLSFGLATAGVPLESETRAWIDLDADGHLDLYRTSASGDRLLTGTGHGFVDRTAELGLDGLASRRVVALDLDRDGRDELLLVGFDGNVRVLRGSPGRILVDPAIVPADLGLGAVAAARPVPGDPPAVLLTGADGREVVLEASGRTGALRVVRGPSVRPSGEDPSGDHAPPPGYEAEEIDEIPCTPSVEDKSGGCLGAGEVPQLGRLHPLSFERFVDAQGRVGIHTLTPTDRLDVDGAAALLGDATGAGATGRSNQPMTAGYLAAPGAAPFDGIASANWDGQELGLVGIATDASATDNRGLLGHSNGAGVRGEHAAAPLTTYGELGTSGRGVVAAGPTLAAELEGDVVVEDGVLSGHDATTDEVVRFEPDDGDGIGLEMENEADQTSVHLESSYSTGAAGRLTFSTAPASPRAFLSGGGADGSGVLSLNSSVPASTIIADGDLLGDGALLVMSSEGLDEETVWVFNNGESGRLYAFDEADTAADNGVLLHARDTGFNDNLQVAATNSVGGIFFSGNSNGGAELAIRETDGSFAMLFRANDLTLYNAAGFATINFDRQTGTKSAVVDAGPHGRRMLYATEAPEAWFEDVGHGRLERGKARVELDPVFLETITIDRENPVLVFVTLNGPGPQPWVELGTDSFVVHAEGAGDAEFDWRAIAKRSGTEELRFPLEEAHADAGQDEALPGEARGERR